MASMGQKTKELSLRDKEAKELGKRDQSII
jgi:hypothetical protein